MSWYFTILNFVSQFCVYCLYGFLHSEISFTVRIGGDGLGSSCGLSYNVGYNVLFQYSTNGGVSWNLIQSYAYNTRSYLTATLNFPSPSWGNRTRLRWTQGYNLGSGTNQWVIDGLALRTSVPTTLFEDFSQSDILAKFATMRYGQVSPSGYCGRSPAAVFDQSTAEARTFSTRTLNLSSYSIDSANPVVIQFELNEGCGTSFGSDPTYYVRLDYYPGAASTPTQLVPTCKIDTSPTGCSSANIDPGKSTSFISSFFQSVRLLHKLLRTIVLV